MTISLAFMVVAFLWSGLKPEAYELAWFAFLYHVAMLLWSILLVVWKKQGFLRLPHWIMFGTTSPLAGAALFS